MRSAIGGGAARSILAAEGAFAPDHRDMPWRPLLAAVVLGGCFYGVCMGSWQLRPLQQIYSAIKTPLLVAAGGLFCIPSFFVLNALLGLRADFGLAMRGVLASQASVALCLAALGPVVLVVYTGVDSYSVAKAVNGVSFLLASLAGHVVLRRHYAALIQRDPRHRIGMLAWLVMFWFVTIQLAWLLRPFIGRPGTPTAFFREDTWGNAYIEVWRAVAGSL